MRVDIDSKAKMRLAAVGFSTAALLALGCGVAAAEDSDSTGSDPGPRRSAATSPDEAKPRTERPARSNRTKPDRDRTAPTRRQAAVEKRDRSLERDDTTTDVDLPVPSLPDAPAEPPSAVPQLWTTLGSARRDVDEPRVSHRAEHAAVTNELVYTDRPTFFDQMVVVSLRVIRAVSTLIGVDLYGQIAKVLESDKPPAFMTRGLEVRRNEYDAGDGTNWEVWEFRPPKPSGRAVIAVHGGGFVVQPLATHWLDYTNMARKTGATVLVPMYPLALTEAGTAVKVVPVMARYMSDQIALYGAKNVSVYADSAGPSLALAAVRELIRAGTPVPARMVLLSFAPDMSMSNPDIFDIDDPIIDLENLDFYTDVNHWSDGLDDKDPLVSSLFIEDEVFAELPPTTIYMGELEWSLPDALLLHEKWSAAGGVVSTVIGLGQIHDWALDGSINSQASKVRPDIYRQLGLLEPADPVRHPGRRPHRS